MSPWWQRVHRMLTRSLLHIVPSPAPVVQCDASCRACLPMRVTLAMSQPALERPCHLIDNLSHVDRELLGDPTEVIVRV